MTPTEALAAAINVEHQVVYGYGVAGAHLSGAARVDALHLLAEHQQRRDDLDGLLTRAGATPPAAAAAYALPFPVNDVTAARSLCATLEDACAGAAWDVVAAATPQSPARALGVAWIASAAIAAVGWRGAPPGPALPGQPR